MDRLTYTVEEAGALLGLSRPSAYAAVAANQIPVLRIGRRLLVAKAAIRKMLGEVEAETAEA